MKPQTIWLGIDLGTTNSAGARVEGTTVRIFRNIKGGDYTPSTVWLDPTNHIRTGQQAYDKAESDPENVAIEFKRNMGSRDEFRFARSGLTMRPEQLSAEILKVVRADAERHTGEAITRAIITIPAAFHGPGRDATLKAAQLAGFEEVEFPQEPFCAALAYSFDHPPHKEFWMVFDFGGGTFDCALMELEDGAIHLLSHGGNNRLGGKNIDWDIVEKVFLPEIERQHGKDETPSRGDRTWLGAIARLKMAAESAKKELSASDSAFVSVEKIESVDGRGGYDFVYTLTPGELENLARPHIEKAIDICRTVLAQGHMEPHHISKLLLVGGPTMMPVVRQMLSAPGTGLGIPLESSIDPLTVVARGAAIFGARKMITTPVDGETARGQYGVAITAPPLSADTDIQVAFTFTAPSGAPPDFSGHTLEVLNTSARPAWNSGKIALPPDGRLMTSVVGRQDTDNVFHLQLFDSVGRGVELTPGQFSTTVQGVNPPPSTLPHSIGVALADNTVRVFMPRDTSLPAKRTEKLHTARHLKAGDPAKLLNVIVLEGERARADRNKHTGRLSIGGEDVTRDVPYNEPIEITLDVDRSGIIRATAYLPILDEFFEEVLKLESTTPTPDELNERLEAVKKRTAELETEATTLECAEAAAALTAFSHGGQIDDLSRLHQAAATDNDAARQADDQMIVAHLSLDKAEEHLAWPRLVHSTRDAIETNLDSDTKISEDGRKESQQLATRADEQIAARDEHGLERTRNRLMVIFFEENRYSLAASMIIEWNRNPPEFKDPAQGQRLLKQGLDYLEVFDGGHRFIINNKEGLLVAMAGLMNLVIGHGDTQDGKGAGVH